MCTHVHAENMEIVEGDDIAGNGLLERLAQVRARPGACQPCHMAMRWCQGHPEGAAALRMAQGSAVALCCAPVLVPGQHAARPHGLCTPPTQLTAAAAQCLAAPAVSTRSQSVLGTVRGSGRAAG